MIQQTIQQKKFLLKNYLNNRLLKIVARISSEEVYYPVTNFIPEENIIHLGTNGNHKNRLNGDFEYLELSEVNYILVCNIVNDQSIEIHPNYYAHNFVKEEPYSQKRLMLLRRWNEQNPDIVKVFIENFLCGVEDICEATGHIKISSPSPYILEQTFDRDENGGAGWISFDRITEVIPNHQKN